MRDLTARHLLSGLDVWLITGHAFMPLARGSLPARTENSRSCSDLCGSTLFSQGPGVFIEIITKPPTTLEEPSVA